MKRFLGCTTAIAAIALSFVLTGCERDAPNRAGSEPVALDRVPAPVRSAIERQLQGGSVRGIQQRTKEGKPIYAVSIAQDGREQRLLLADDGKLISSRPATDDDEEDDD
ncbi:hypothetical protein [Burkholderia pyrrocinia]|uniref:hypothetical protein n=1 Tax=Burkholderia pyrrocinia TaxID=60550 RepID=UPI002AB2C26B|nr:hypothetical protein [Burkholderia pyrrocinia]